MSSLEAVVFVAPDERGDVKGWIVPDVFNHQTYIFRGETLLFENLIAKPHYLAHMKVAVVLRTLLEILHREHAHDIETHRIGNDIRTVHRLALRHRIILPVERIVLAEILVDGYAYRAVTYYNTVL